MSDTVSLWDQGKKKPLIVAKYREEKKEEEG